MLKKIALFTSLASLTGCATMFSGSTQTVSVQAIDSITHQVIPGAVCSITDGKGVVYPLNSNPGSVILTRGNGALNTICRKEGYHQISVGAGQSFNAWTVADVLFWPGAIVDVATGASQKYPSHITVIMSRKADKKH